MSYPRKLHILIIEDEQDPIDAYRELLRALGTSYSMVEPTVVRSYDDGRHYIKGPNIFHLVILDLNLPLKTKHQPADGVATGLQLLDHLAQREEYPVPAVLVVSGKLNTARLTELHSRLSTDFWYGALLNKGDDSLASELETGLKEAQRYCDVGVHVADPHEAWYPPLSPREEDLLRRCVLSQSGCLGVDLRWWSAESAPSFGRSPSTIAPTKVLCGSFLLDDGMGTSRPAFFKFEASADGCATSRDAALLAHKLSHVQVKYTWSTRTRSLLVTQSVTDGTPVPLDVYLSGEPAEIIPSIPALIEDIFVQMDRLGESVDAQKPVQQFLWGFHDRDRIAEALQRYETGPPAGNIDPLKLFDVLAASNQLMWTGTRCCTHGDLNATNVAVEVKPGERPRAFIFDAAGVHADTDTRDLAMLEVTSLLFNKVLDRNLQDDCMNRLYGQAFVPIDLEALTGPPSVRNTLQFISFVRRKIGQQGKQAGYALMVFDAVLMQLGGLAIQPSNNKISDGAFCHRLACSTGAWLLRMTPELQSDL